MFSEPWVSHFGDATRKIQGQDKRQVSPLPPTSPSCWRHDHQAIQNRAPRFYKEDPSESRLELNLSFSCHICIFVVQSLSRIRLFVTPWTVACQAPLSMGFSRQKYWNGFPFHPPEDLSDPRIKPRSPVLQADSSPSELPGKP